MVDWLYSNTESDSNIKKRLNNLGVQHIHVTYEKLFQTTDNDASEWIRLLTFLDDEDNYNDKDKDEDKGKDDDVLPSKKYQNITMATVRNTFSMASTHTKSQKEIIANYDALKKM